MRIQETEIFKFDELSDDAKKVAIENQSQWHYQDDYLTELIREGLTFKAHQEYGIDLDNLKLEFSLSHCQGDGVAFYGSLDNETMLRMLDKQRLNLESLDETHESLLEKFTEINLDIERNSFGNHYSHWNTMTTELNFEDMECSDYQLIEHLEKFTDEIQEIFKDLVQTISRDLESFGYEIIDDYCSEETCKDAIEANGYEYYADGGIA